MTVNRRISFCSKVSCSTVMYMLLVHQLNVFLGRCFWARFVLPLWRLRRGWMSFYVSFLRLQWRRFKRRFDEFSRDTLPFPESEQLWGDWQSSLNVGTVSIEIFDAYATLCFFSFITVSVLHLTKVAIGVMNYFEVTILFDIPSAVA